jgi:large subunit ribosomal protein L5
MGKLYERYRSEIRPQLQKDLGITNPMAVPKITKVTLNMGVGEAIADRKVMESAVTDMTAIAGQQPVICLARKSEAGFKIREGYPSAARSRCVVSACTTSSSVW